MSKRSQTASAHRTSVTLAANRLDDIASVRCDKLIALLAGNSRVAISEDGYSLIIEPQLHAFKAALVRAAEIRELTGELPQISVAFDHQGIFRKNFLALGLTNSQKKHPRLTQLHPEIRAVFEPIANDLKIPLGKVSAIHEDSARTHASHLLKLNNLSPDIVRVMKVKDDENDEDSTENGGNQSACTVSCGLGQSGTNRVTCAAVTSEYFARSLTPTSEVLEVFIENDPWSQLRVYVRGAVLAERLGNTVAIRLLLVDNGGHVFGRKWNIDIDDENDALRSTSGRVEAGAIP